MSELTSLVSEIVPADLTAREECQKHLDHIAKPLGSLGHLKPSFAE